MNISLGNTVLIICIFLLIIFAVMCIIAKKQVRYKKSKNDSSVQNDLYMKRVVFIEDENDPVNADGVRGHLEAVQDVEYVPTFYAKYIKRAFDILISFFGMIFLAPFYLIIVVLIKIDDPGPALFKQKRISQFNGWFELIKFRSMSVNTPNDVPTHMLENGGITKVGAFIRKTSIDELGQLWNIFRSDMSLIGPRPALWNQDFLIAERDKHGANDVKPGLTGLAQISGRDELEISVKAELDGEYSDLLKKSSLSGFKIDTIIFLKSIFSVLNRKGVVDNRTTTVVEAKDLIIEEVDKYEESAHNRS